MKNISAVTLFTIATLAATNGLFAQEPSAKANIPFNFTVGDKSMPAGEYTISLTSEHVVKIQSADKLQVDLAIASKSYQEPGAKGQLVFDKVGDYYFLRQHLVSDLVFDEPLNRVGESRKAGADP
jgi:hypothetical protein